MREEEAHASSFLMCDWHRSRATAARCDKTFDALGLAPSNNHMPCKEVRPKVTVARAGGVPLHRQRANEKESEKARGGLGHLRFEVGDARRDDVARHDFFA